MRVLPGGRGFGCEGDDTPYPPLSPGMFLTLMSDCGFPLFHTCCGSPTPSREGEALWLVE